MALVTYVLGDCPACMAPNAFGNVDVFGDHVYRGCKRCRHNQRVALPALRKKVLYLDQFFFSHAFRGGDPRFVAAVNRIARLAALQLLVSPFSSIHEDETHQWARHGELMKFIKSTSRGHEFEPAYEVDRKQVLKSFKVWLVGKPAAYALELDDAIEDDVHAWDSYMRIDVGRYAGDIELIRDLKKQSVEGLVKLFDGWRKQRTTFEDDLKAEYEAAGKSYIDFYMEFALRIARGDYMAMFDAPIISTVVQSMLHIIPEDVPSDQKLRRCAQFFMSSEHFKEMPHQWLNAHMLSTLKLAVKQGAYTNQDRTVDRLSGVFYDVQHIATYAPYVDAFVMDQPMAELVSRPTVQLEKRYGTKIFSLNNWGEFLEWMDQIEGDMTAEHKEGLQLAYPTKS